MEFDMLSAVRSRTKSYGISTAAPFLRQLEQCLGGNCPSSVLKGVSQFSWQKALENAERQLVYHNPDMGFSGAFAHFDEKAAKAAELPPYTIASFPATITTTRQDRDGDVLETKGAELDPSAPLLWQHLPFEPIGKLLKETKHTSKLLAGDFSICATPLGEDAAMLAEHGALDISHGFTTDDYEPLDDKEYDIPGFHVLKFKILEVSLVSIPSNPDAEITAFSRNKLHHPLVKALAGVKYDNRPVVSAVGIDVAALANSMPAGSTLTLSKANEGSTGRLDKVTDAVAIKTEETMQASNQFAIGEYVEPTVPPHMSGAEGPGIVEIIDAGPAYGIRFDDMPDEIHKWYVQSELKPSSAKNKTMGVGCGCKNPAEPLTVKGAVPYKNTPAEDEGTAWDAGAAEKRLRSWSGVDGDEPTAAEWNKFKQGFAYFDGEGDKLGDFKLPHHDVKDGKLVVVFKGCSAAIGALNGARGGGMKMSESDRKKVYTHLAKHYKDRFSDQEVPELKCVEPLRYKGQERDFYNPQKSLFFNRPLLDSKGVYVEFENSFDDIRCDLNDVLLTFLMANQEADANDYAFIVDLFLYQALVQVCDRYSYGYGDDSRCYYLIDWEMGPDEEPVWTGTPQPVEVKPQIVELSERAFDMFVKSMPAKHMRALKKAMDYSSKAADHEDATDVITDMANKAFDAIQSVHDAHDEKSASMPVEHMKKLDKAMGHLSKGMDHADATDTIKGYFKSAHTHVKSVMDDMGDMSGEESLESLIQKQNKAGRRVSVANEKKLKAVASSFKAIADDDEADGEVSSLAGKGYSSVKSIFSTGGDNASDYDEDGNYTGDNMHAYMADGDSGGSGKAGRAISKDTAAKIKEAVTHGEAIAAHEKANADHKSLAKKAVKKLKGVLGEETPHEDADDNSMNLVAQDEPAGKSLKELCEAEYRSALVDQALTGNLSALENLASVLTEAEKNANDTISRIQRQRQWDAEQAVILSAAASV